MDSVFPFRDRVLNRTLWPLRGWLWSVRHNGFLWTWRTLKVFGGLK